MYPGLQKRSCEAPVNETYAASLEYIYRVLLTDTTIGYAAMQVTILVRGAEVSPPLPLLLE